jgi:branched-chain amino acid transport system substrate-binding protein
MLRLETLLTRRLAPAAVCALAIAACGSSQKPSAATTSTTGTPPSHSATKTVEIYSSLPESGSDASRSHQIETGIKFALAGAHYKAGGFTVKYKALCDSSRTVTHRSHPPTSRGKISTSTRTTTRKCAGDWSQTAAAANAEQAAINPQTVAYIGDLNSGATEVSLPILNQAGIVQITPGSGYVGLTDTVTVNNPKNVGAITQPGEPGKYYPQGLDNRTFLRMIPNDLVQASAALDVLHKAGCQKFSAWNFGSDGESRSLLAAVIATASKYKMLYVQAPPLSAKTKYENYAAHVVAPTGIHCAVMVGHVTKAAEALTLELHEQLPPPFTIVGTDGFCTADWVQGISSIYRKTVADELYCTTPALPVNKYAGSGTFIAAFRKAFKRLPTAYDLYGYAATEMLLRALLDTDTKEDTRSQVLSNMVYGYAPSEVTETPGQIKAFSFAPDDGNLETSNDAGINKYGVDAFKHGTPQHFETASIDTAHLLSSG